MLGNHVQAREAFGKLMGLPPQVLLNPMIDARLAMAVFYAGNGEFGTAMKTFDAILLDMQRQNAHGFFVGISKSYYAWALGRQGRNEEAAKQLREVEECYANIAGMVKHVNVQVSLMAPVRAIVDQVFEIRLDMVNVSRARGSLVAIKDFFPEGLRVCSISAGFNLKNRSVESKEKTLEPFSVASVVLALQAAEAKRFNLTPKVDYIDDFGNNKTAKPQTIQINVSPKPMRTELEDSALSTRQENIEFGSQAAEKAFDYLLRSFAEDYVRRKMPKEKAGWRTLMDIVRQGKITRHSVYGSSRGRRQTLAELEQSHLIETRMFSGERGRGGVVRKVRVCYEKENIKRLVDRDSTV
jgi:hypothetical protein